MAWGYANSCCPPDAWASQFPAGAGACQSPVNITNVVYSSELKKGVSYLSFWNIIK